jgi:7-keto-8-aminopelargonate synthetase-like enzyme
MTSGAVMMEGPAGREVIMHGRKHLYFAGTGYFELQADPRMIKAANRASTKFGIGAATSRALAGTNPLLLELEERISTFFQSEDAVFLPSGYLSNLAGLKALNEMEHYDVILLDENAHYSLVDGAAAVGKPVCRFNHLDTEDLLLKLKQASADNQRPLIATDGLFPVRAQLAPLDRYLTLAEEYNGLIWVDDAHGVGILGENGRGSLEHFGLNSPRIHVGATLSKAFGAYGGIIFGKGNFISQVKYGGVVTGSTPPMNAAIAAGLKGLELVQKNPEMRQSLYENARLLKSGLASLGIPVDNNHFPIVAFKLERELQMAELQQNLLKEGIFIQYAKYQGAGSEGVIRIVVFSTHTSHQIDRLIRSLKKYLPEIN